MPLTTEIHGEIHSETCTGALSAAHYHRLGFILRLGLIELGRNRGVLKVGATIGQRPDGGRLAFVPAYSQIGCRGSGGRRQRALRAFLDPEKLAYEFPAAHEFAPASLRACLNLNAPEIDRIMIRLS